MKKFALRRKSKNKSNRDGQNKQDKRDLKNPCLSCLSCLSLSDFLRVPKLKLMQNLYENDWLYDLVHEKPADSEQVAFYERKIKNCGSPVLELACGTRNYLVVLSGEDVGISGTDISEDMRGGA